MRVDAHGKTRHPPAMFDDDGNALVLTEEGVTKWAGEQVTLGAARTSRRSASATRGSSRSRRRRHLAGAPAGRAVQAPCGERGVPTALALAHDDARLAVACTNLGVRITPDGDRLATSAADGTKLWRVARAATAP